MALHPAWWANVLTTEPLRFASLKSPPTTVARVANLFDAALTPDDVTWLRGLWRGPLVVKGILTADDARLAVDAGADGVVVSSHGSRQLDLSPTPLEVLPEVVAAVGDRAEVFLDSGILTGADVVAAVAMGARACHVARAYCYGLMAGGERGVQRAAELLQAEIVRTMALLGVSAVSDLTPDRVRLRPPGA
jgi:L-lactate dehydrogenase (cytochrome)